MAGPAARTRSPPPTGPAGYRYDISILQAEFSLTQVLDRPLSGRVFFEEVIRENLDLGRPDQVALIFDRRVIRNGRTRPRAGSAPGSSPTGSSRRCTSTTSTRRIKQYHKEGRALRTETTINDTRDFGIGKRLTNLPALRQVGFSANRRLLDVQRISHDPITGTDALPPSPHPDHRGRQPYPRAALRRPPRPRPAGRLAPVPSAAQRLHQPRPAHLDRRLRALPAEQVTAGQMTYDLRRLRAHGLIARIPHTHRYRSPTTAYIPHCSCLPCTTDTCRPAWLTSPTTPPHHHCRQLPAHTKRPSKPSVTQQDSPHNANNSTTQHQT